MLRQQVAKLQATVAAQQATIQQLQVWGLLQAGPAGLPVAHVQAELLSAKLTQAAADLVRHACVAQKAFSYNAG